VLNPSKRRLGVALSCAFGFVASFIFITRPGIYWFALVDSYVVWAVFAVAVLECWGVARAYGARRFAAEIGAASGRAIPTIVQSFWTWVTPGMCTLLGVVSLALALGKVNARYEGARETIAGRIVAVLLMLGPLGVMVVGAADPEAALLKRLWSFFFWTKSSSAGLRFGYHRSRPPAEKLEPQKEVQLTDLSDDAGLSRVVVSSSSSGDEDVVDSGEEADLTLAYDDDVAGGPVAGVV